MIDMATKKLVTASIETEGANHLTSMAIHDFR